MRFYIAISAFFLTLVAIIFWMVAQTVTPQTQTSVFPLESYQVADRESAGALQSYLLDRSLLFPMENGAFLLDWDQLKTVSFASDPLTPAPMAIFHNELELKEGNQVLLTGYLYNTPTPSDFGILCQRPLEQTSNNSDPFTSNSLVEIQYHPSAARTLSEWPKDQPCRLKGILQLNRNNPQLLPYSLVEVRPVRP